MSRPTSPTPDTPPDPAHAGDLTLAGYIETHNRPPAFEAVDGSPYTVSMEVEKTADLRAPCHGYLVFPRWADTGAGIVGHVETETLVRARSAADAERELGALTLIEVQAILDAAVAGTDRTPTPPEQAPHAS